jgi:hypothetical protein
MAVPLLNGSSSWLKWLQRLVWLAVAGSAEAPKFYNLPYRSLYSLLNLNRSERASRSNPDKPEQPTATEQLPEPSVPLGARATHGGVFFGSLPWTTGSSKMVGTVISLHAPKALTREYRSESRELNGAIHPCPGRLRPGITPTFMSRTRDFMRVKCGRCTQSTFIR